MTELLTLEKLRFPIGQFQFKAAKSESEIEAWKEVIASFPSRLKALTKGLSESQLDTPYRPEGWTVRQVVHHCADSHMNSFIRFKLALTEDHPTIRPYFEDRWAELLDGKMDISVSLTLLEGLHQRWTKLLNNLSSEDLKRCFVHPEHGKVISLEENLSFYAWHCNHHYAHIEELGKREGWF